MRQILAACLACQRPVAAGLAVGPPLEIPPRYKQAPETGRRILVETSAWCCGLCVARIKADGEEQKSVKQEAFGEIHVNDELNQKVYLPFLPDKEKGKVPTGKEEPCIYCDKILSSFLSLYGHIKHKHKNEALKCSFRCSAFFKTEEERQEHIKQKHESCRFCDLKFVNRASLMMHLKHMHGVDKRCTMHGCSGRFDSEAALANHMGTVHASAFSCGSCWRVFNSKPGLKRHFKIHHPSSGGLSRLRRSRTQSTQDQKCAKCFEILPLGQLDCQRCWPKNEFLIPLPPQPPRFWCHDCGKGFAKKISLSLHWKFGHYALTLAF